jgi:hypothetical protein
MAVAMAERSRGAAGEEDRVGALTKLQWGPWRFDLIHPTWARRLHGCELEAVVEDAVASSIVVIVCMSL